MYLHDQCAEDLTHYDNILFMVRMELEHLFNHVDEPTLVVVFIQRLYEDVKTAAQFLSIGAVDVVLTLEKNAHLFSMCVTPCSSSLP
jgi:hypothetical protein